MITQKKYDFLKNLSTALTNIDRAEMTEFENSKIKKITPQAEKYFREMKRSDLKGDYSVNHTKLLKAFKTKFKELQGREFDEIHLNNLSCILEYFSKEPNFLKNQLQCKNKKGEYISTPSFEKGLLIIGDYGCGKSSTMQTLKELFNNTPLAFKSYTTNRIVTTFESYSDTEQRTAYMNRTKTKDAYFDDIKTEKDASNYGLHNLMKDVLEERYNNKAVTYATCNFVENDSEKSISKALYEFNSRYGARVFDRLFEMFNIIEFKGGSMRK
jgi:DNA replication protein DnaC